MLVRCRFIRVLNVRFRLYLRTNTRILHAIRKIVCSALHTNILHALHWRQIQNKIHTMEISRSDGSRAQWCSDNTQPPLFVSLTCAPRFSFVTTHTQRRYVTKIPRIQYIVSIHETRRNPPLHPIVVDVIYASFVDVLIFHHTIYIIHEQYIKNIAPRDTSTHCLRLASSAQTQKHTGSLCSDYTYTEYLTMIYSM